MSPGQQVALEQALAHVLAEHLDGPAAAVEPLVPLVDLDLPAPAGDVEDVLQPVAGQLVGREGEVGVGVVAGHLAQPAAQHPGGLVRRGAGAVHAYAEVPPVRQPQVVRQPAAVGDRVGAHPPLPRRAQLAELGHQRAGLVEQLLRLVRPQPRLERLPVLGILPDGGQRHLVGPEGALDLLPVDHRRTGPALRRTQNDHRPAGGGVVLRALGPRGLLDGGDLVQAGGHRLGHGLVHGGRIVADHMVRLEAVSAHQGLQLLGRDAGEQRRVGDLVLVEGQDRQHRAVAGRVDELGAVPAASQRPRLGLPVADHAEDGEIGRVQRGPVRVQQRVAELAALVERPRRLRRAMTGHAARVGELVEEGGHARLVRSDVAEQLGEGALQPGAGVRARPAVPGAGDEDRIQVALDDQPVGVGVHQVEPGNRAEVAEQPRLDVLGDQRLAQQRVGLEVDLAHREVVGRAPPGIDPVQGVGVERAGRVAERVRGGWPGLPGAGGVLVGGGVPAHAGKLRHGDCLPQGRQPLAADGSVAGGPGVVRSARSPGREPR